MVTHEDDISSNLSELQIKLYWNTAQFIRSRTVYGCFWRRWRRL